MSRPSASFDLRLLETSVATLPCVVRGPPDGPQLLVLPPLFEEMNRTRRLLTEIGRRLAERGIGSWLPDLPGTGDSDLPSAEMDWALWRESLHVLSHHIRANSSNGLHIFSIRGGALLDDAVPGRSRYRLAPAVSGDRLLRELMRARMAADQERGTPMTLADLSERLTRETIELAGYPITPKFAADLRAATLPASLEPVRTAGLSDGVADVSLDGPPVWRQAEPAAAQALAAQLADDIAQWIATCDAH